MRSRFPSFLRADGLALVLLLGVASCGFGDAGLPPGDDQPNAAPDRVISGPQGDVGQFVVECGFSHFLPDDPIVHPGEPGGSHLHQFFGAVDASVDATEQLLLDGETTCDQRADTASYWTPALVDGDQNLIEPIKAVAYYRAGPDVDPLEVVAYPPGMMLVAGDHTAVEPQPLSVVSWSCATGGLRSATPLDCTGATSMRMSVTFQDCWDGEHVRSPIVPDPDLHVAYSAAGECPATHPVHLLQLQLAIDFPPVAATDLDGLALASGDILLRTCRLLEYLGSGQARERGHPLSAPQPAVRHQRLTTTLRLTDVVGVTCGRRRRPAGGTVGCVPRAGC